MPNSAFPACRNGLCGQGRRICPTPQACQVPEPEDTCPAWLAWLLRLAGRVTVRQFWIGYSAGIVSGVVGFAVYARL